MVCQNRKVAIYTSLRQKWRSTCWLFEGLVEGDLRSHENSQIFFVTETYLVWNAKKAPQDFLVTFESGKISTMSVNTALSTCVFWAYVWTATTTVQLLSIGISFKTELVLSKHIRQESRGSKVSQSREISSTWTQPNYKRTCSASSGLLHLCCSIMLLLPVNISQFTCYIQTSAFSGHLREPAPDAEWRVFT